MSTGSTKRIGIVFLTTVALAPFAAHAQTAPAPVPAAAPANDGADLGDIVVTARRSSESLQKVPIAITAFSQATLTRQAIASPFELNKAVPGLTVEANGGNPGLPSFSIRGRGLNYGAASGSVETYFADIPLSGPYQAPGLPVQIFDLQSLQVLKGPQGTLFGRNTTGGAVLLVPQAPTNEFGGYGRIQAGNYADVQAEGAINIPLAQDKAALRVAGFFWKQHGFMHVLPSTDQLTGAALPAQTYNNHNQWDIRATLKLTPFEGFENSTIFTYHWDKERYSSGPGFTLTWAGCPAGTLYLGCTFIPGFSPNATPSVAPSAGAGTRYGPGGVNLYRPANKSWAAINTTSYEVAEGLTLKNIFGYIWAKGYTADAQDVSGTGLYVLDLQIPNRPRLNKQLTDEVQLQGRGFDDRLTWIVGGLIDRNYQPRGRNTMDIASTTLSAPGLPQQAFQAENLASESIFGSATYKVTDKFSVTGGYRHTWNDIKDDIVPGQAGYTGIILPTTEIVYLHKKEQGDTYNVGLDYQLTSDTLVYASYRHGYKRGGFNPAADPAHASFGGEAINSFALGLKSSFHAGGMPVRFNIEGYYDRYKGLQVSYLSIDPATFKLQDITANVPKTRYLGFDTDVTIEASSWLTLSGNYTLIDAKNMDWVDNSVAGKSQDLSVNPVGFASRNKFSVTARLHDELAGSKGEIAFAPSVHYQSKFYTSPFAIVTPYAQQAIFGPINQAMFGAITIPGYTTADLRLEWNNVLGSKVSVAGNVINLTNKLYYTGDNGNLGIGVQGRAYGAPRLFSADVSIKF